MNEAISNSFTPINELHMTTASVRKAEIPKRFKFWIYFTYVGTLASLIDLYRSPILMVIFILINIGIFVLIWKGILYVIQHQEEISHNKKARILRWFFLFYFSVIWIKIGTIFGFLLRIPLDNYIINLKELSFTGNKSADLQAIFLSRFESLFLYLPPIIALPYLIRLSSWLKFKNITRSGLSISLFWILLYLLGGFIFKK